MRAFCVFDTPLGMYYPWHIRTPAGFFNLETTMNLLSYLKHVRAEMKHVVWPDASISASHTVILIVIGAFTAVYLGLLDYVFTKGVAMVLSNF